MDLLKGNVRQIYFRYLGAAFGSALISSVYSMADMAMVGQYQGPDGIAALAVVAPVWNIIYSLGLLTGIGGSVLLSAARGAGRQKEGNEYFTAALAGTVFFAAVSWLAIAFFDAPLLRLFGARDALLPLAQQYLLPVKFVVPLFLFNQMLAAFLRNDGAPGLATAAVLAGGVFNVFGDYFFVFTCDMGVFGAGLATAIGSGITFTVMLSHFFSRRCTLRPVRFRNAGTKLRQILTTGFSTFFLDIAMGILTMLFNRQCAMVEDSVLMARRGVRPHRLHRSVRAHAFLQPRHPLRLGPPLYGVLYRFEQTSGRTPEQKEIRSRHAVDGLHQHAGRAARPGGGHGGHVFQRKESPRAGYPGNCGHAPGLEPWAVRHLS